MTIDHKGSTWATVKDTVAGSLVRVDDGFCCMPDKAVNRLVCEDDKGLYVACSVGHHYLNCRLSTSGAFYVGFYPAPATVKEKVP